MYIYFICTACTFYFATLQHGMKYECSIYTHPHCTLWIFFCLLLSLKFIFFFFWGAPQTNYAHTACCGWISWCWLWNSNLFCFFWSEPLTLRYIHIHVKLYNLRDVTSSSTLQLLNCTLWMGLPVDYYQLWKGKLFGLKVKYWTWDDIDRAINWKAQDAVSCSTTPTDPQ